MQLWHWMVMVGGWVVAGPVFVTLFDRLGLRYRVRSSVPYASGIPDPRDVTPGRRRKTSLPSRSGADRPVRPHSPPPRVMPEHPEPDGTGDRSPQWWDGGMGPVVETQSDQMAGD